MHAAGIDDLDHLPVWRCVPGETALGDCVVVERLGIGHRTETWLAWSSRSLVPGRREARPPRADAPPARARHPASRGRRPRRLGAPGAAPPRRAPPGPRVPHVLTEYVDGPTLDELVDEEGPSDPATPPCSAPSSCPALGRSARSRPRPPRREARERRAPRRPTGPDRLRLLTSGRQPPAAGPPRRHRRLRRSGDGGLRAGLRGDGPLRARHRARRGDHGVPFPEGSRLPRSRLGPLVRRLLDDDPASRGSMPDVLVELAAACGARRPWPAWLDARSASVRAG